MYWTILGRCFMRCPCLSPIAMAHMGLKSHNKFNSTFHKITYFMGNNIVFGMIWSFFIYFNIGPSSKVVELEQQNLFDQTETKNTYYSLYIYFCSYVEQAFQKYYIYFLRFIKV